MDRSGGVLQPHVAGCIRSVQCEVAYPKLLVLAPHGQVPDVGATVLQQQGAQVWEVHALWVVERPLPATQYYAYPVEVRIEPMDHSWRLQRRLDFPIFEDVEFGLEL